VLTSVTTLLAVAIMYTAGGSGIRSFSYTLLIGLVVGTYSSVAIAAPLVVRSATGRKGPTVAVDDNAAMQDQADTSPA
jgi:preprotein translocase subunit SecF